MATSARLPPFAIPLEFTDASGSTYYELDVFNLPDVVGLLRPNIFKYLLLNYNLKYSG